MERVVWPQEMRQFEKEMFAGGTDSLLVMEHAGSAAARIALEHNPRKVLIFCGPGNNGGDGFIAARHLILQGIPCKVYVLCPREKLQGDALKAFLACQGAGAEPVFCKEALWETEETDGNLGMIDALFGIGLNRPLEPLFARAVEWMNEVRRINPQSFITAVDLPSGIGSGDGKILGEQALRADATVTFQWKKPGHLLFPGREYSGKVFVEKIGRWDCWRQEHSSQALLLQEEDFQKLKERLIMRPPNSHKGTYGRALLVAGSQNFAGAAVLSAGAALKTGTGLLSVLTTSRAAQALNTALPEAMALEAPGQWLGEEALKLLEGALPGKNCIGIGCGLGNRPQTFALVRRAADSGLPMVLDADGLNALTGHLSEVDLSRAILTPHPGEMGRLMGVKTETVAEDPLYFARKLCIKTRAVVLLKGATTIIATPGEPPVFNCFGGPQLARGGSGDVLTGIILGLLAQGFDRSEAAMGGAMLLGKAAEQVSLPAPCVLGRDIIAALGDVLS